MKGNDKDTIQAPSSDQDQESKLGQTIIGHESHNGHATTGEPVSKVEDSGAKIGPTGEKDSLPLGNADASVKKDVDQDQDMADASPIPAEVIEQDTPMNEAAPHVLSVAESGMGQAIDQDDLDGGLLDGALDDYDDLDQDTEDTEVGNGDHDFSDDDDDLDDVDDRLLDSSDKPGPDDEILSLEETIQTKRSEDHDMDTHHDTDMQERDSEDSDSDLAEPEGSDNDHEEDEDGGEADEEDVEEDDEEEDEDESLSKPTGLRKDSGAPLSQKPVLHRPAAAEEELKDSGDDLSDLSEFDDTDDSDEDDDMPGIKTSQKEPSTKASVPATLALTPSATNNIKPMPGRKRSIQETNKDPSKQDQESIKAEQQDQIEIPNKRARLSEPANRNISLDTEDAQNSDKESVSEAAEDEEEEEEEEEEEKAVGEEAEGEGEGEGDEGEDEETKQMHKEALNALTSIEVEFANLRDKMYEERMAELDREVEMINDGTHPELSSLMQEIEQKREHRLRVAEMGKKYKTDIAQSQYVVQEYQAHCSFQSARRNARAGMVRTLGKKQQQLILELTLSSDTRQRNVIADKSSLVRARKLKRAEVNELKAVSERMGFPVSTKPSSATSAELDEDFVAMGSYSLP
ncbi:Transcriptional regulatory protein [Mortierella sp. GBA30]|nr:Transcriptional regulatory protein [Mortierella sp. GBA30]